MAILDQSNAMNNKQTNGSTEALAGMNSRGGDNRHVEIVPGSGIEKTKQEVTFSCQDIRLKQDSRSTEDLKSKLLFQCASAMLDAMFNRKTVNSKTGPVVNREEGLLLSGDNKEVMNNDNKDINSCYYCK